MSVIINEIKRQSKLDKDSVYLDLTLESYCSNIKKFYTDIAVKDMLRNLLIEVLENGSMYYFNRFVNLEYAQGSTDIRNSFCVYTNIPKDYNEDLELKFKLIERKLCIQD